MEAKGIKRSFEKVKNSDAVIFMLDVSDQLSETDFEIHDLIKDKKKLIVANKMDIVKEEVLEKMELAFPGDKIVEISVKENTNIDKIFSFLEHFVSHMKKGKESFGINQRQKRILEALTVILNKTGKMVKDRSSPVELIAEEIRLAIQKIGELTGEITPDEILHQIFSEFCVGK